jgi:hypothetical protein
VENVKDEGEGEEEEQWLVVEIAGVGGELLSTLRCSCEQWRMQKMKEKEKRKPVVKASCSPLFTIHCSVSALFLVASVYNTVCNSTQKAA